MAEPKTDNSSEALLHQKHHNKETHGLRDDINENTSIKDVKGPNVFERAKEEIEAIVETLHPQKGHKNQASPPNEKRDEAVDTGLKKQSSDADEHMNASNKMKQEKVEVKAEVHKEKSPGHHHKETHGKDDIDVNIPISEFKGPSIFDRAKEEIEALVQTIHPKKESATPKKKGGFRASIGRKLEKICSPKSHNRD